MALRKQMEMFEDGGLKDEGGMVDEVSGNDVPPGSTREEVRDDIPAQLSEGEFVFPADVVRYIGLEKLMKMRQQAKQGLKAMEEMGQMGNSEEATIPDDLPFDETDLDIEDDLEYNLGGVIEGSRTGKAAEEGQKEVYAPGNFDNLVSASPIGAPETKSVRYYNEQLKQVRMIPHLINPDGSIGNTIYPVPKGFVPQEEPVEKPVKEEEQASGKKQQQQDDNNDNDDPTGDLGGARTTIGGTEYAVQYNFDGTIGLQSLNNYNATGRVNFQTAKPEIAEAIKTQTTGQLAQLGKVRGLSVVAVAEVAKKMGVNPPKYDKLNATIKKAEKATKFLNGVKPAEVSVFEAGQFLEKGQTISDKDFQAKTGKKKTGKDLYSRPARDPLFGDMKEDRITGKGAEGLTEKDMRSIQSGLQSKTGTLDTSGIDTSGISSGISDDSFSDDQGQSSGDGVGESGPSGQGDPSGFGGTYKGSLITRKKPKPKKMKRGGLALR